MRWARRPLILFGVSRLVVILAAYLAVVFLGHTMTADAYHLRGTDNVLVDVFGSRWDTGFYVSIVEEGYQFRGVQFPSVAFFPLLPLLMRFLLPLTGDAVVAGLLVSNGALLLASLLFYRLVSLAHTEALADRALWYLLIFPTAFFGSAIYTESLFLLGAIGALFFARRGRWDLAAVLAFAVGLSRLMGLVVAPMLALEWWRRRRSDAIADRPEEGRKHSRRVLAVAAVLAAPAGLAAYMTYLWRAFGDPLAFARASAAWERLPQAPGDTITRLLETPPGGWLQALGAGTLPLNEWIDLGFVLFFLIAAFILLYRRQWVEGVFVWLGVMLPLSSGLLLSQRRYVWVLFPVYVLLAQWGGRFFWVDRFITAAFLALQITFVILFANGYWVA